MNILLLFFALPIATIILAVVIEKILRCPFLTAATFFAIFLIVAFAVFDANFLIFVIFYTILAFIAALIAEFSFRRCNDERKCCIRWCNCNHNENENNNTRNTITLSNRDIRRIAEQLERIQNNNNDNDCCHNNSCNCCNCSNDMATVNVTNNKAGGRTTWCCRRR